MFGSKVEVIVYQDNKLDPDIEIMEMHPSFPLIPAFLIKDKKFNITIYTADQLVYLRSLKREEVWEVKSPGTERMADYRLRRTLFLYLYPEIVFREIIFNKQKGRSTERTDKVYEPRTRITELKSSTGW